MIQTSEDGGVLTITLNRPDRANSLTEAMLRDLVQIFRGARDARAVILTGAGDKVFSAGADLEEARAGLATSPVWEDASGALADLPCLTIAALNGTLAGGAFGMALACDLRISVPQASFFYPVAKLGFLPQPSDPGRLRALIGPARAKLILVAGARISAEEALRFGLIDRLCAPEDLMREADALTQTTRDGDPANLRQIKTMIRQA